MIGYPSRDQAECLLQEAEYCNPGPWGSHSRIAARCAEKIAAAAGMDAQKAYVLGLLHDIGRRLGKGHLSHVYHGYHYLMALGYPDAARICLTHSFCKPYLNVYIGNFDIPKQQQSELQQLLNGIEYDDYDRLIQLCDCLAGADGIMDMEARMLDVKRRYGIYPQEKWDTNIGLRHYFEEKAGTDIYQIVK